MSRCSLSHCSSSLSTDRSVVCEYVVVWLSCCVPLTFSLWLFHLLQLSVDLVAGMPITILLCSQSCFRVTATSGNCSPIPPTTHPTDFLLSIQAKPNAARTTTGDQQQHFRLVGGDRQEKMGLDTNETNAEQTHPFIRNRQRLDSHEPIQNRIHCPPKPKSRPRREVLTNLIISQTTKGNNQPTHHILKQTNKPTNQPTKKESR